MHQPALDRGLDELARRISANRSAPRARVGLRVGLEEAGKVVLALILSVPLVLWLTKLVFSGHAYFVAQGFSTRQASRLGGWLALGVLFVLALLVRRLWPERVARDDRKREDRDPPVPDLHDDF